MTTLWARWKTWIRRNNPHDDGGLPLSTIEKTFYVAGAIAVLASWTSAAIGN